MTNDTAELRKLAEAATPGPWCKCGGATPAFIAITTPTEYIIFGMADASTDREGNGDSIVAPDMWKQQANAAYIAAANPSVLLALLDRLEAPTDRVDTEWQPIETAPKTGEPILVCDNGPFAYVVEWFAANRSWIGGDGMYWQPTHWKPLPSPPAILTERAQS